MDEPVALEDTPPPFVPGWHKQPEDRRDLVLAAPDVDVDAGDWPDSVDLTVPALGHPFEPALNQGASSSCGPNTMAEFLVYNQMAFGQTPVLPSRLFIYWCTRVLMGTTTEDSGVFNRAMLKAIAKYGWCPESMWPFDLNKITVEPPAACFAAALQNRIITQYRAVPKTLSAMLSCLTGTPERQARPFVFGFKVYQSYQDRETFRTGIIPDPQPGEPDLGGHDMLAVGFNRKERYFILKQHYGPNYGKAVKAGYGRISFANALANGDDFWMAYTPWELTPAA